MTNSSASKWFTPGRWWMTLLGASAIVVGVSILMSRSYIGHRALDMNESGRVSSCQSLTLSAMRPQPQAVDIALLGNIYSMCYQEASQEDTLVDFGIRKSAYLNQQVQTPILLWMVVTITLSGVILAGMQLIAAYRLATAGKGSLDQGGGELGVESGKISLKSSVTGLLILAISLAFFMVFVSKVYLIQDTHAQVDAPTVHTAFPAVVGMAPQTVATPQAQRGFPAAAVATRPAVPGQSQPSPSGAHAFPAAAGLGPASSYLQNARQASR